MIVFLATAIVFCAFAYLVGRADVMASVARDRRLADLIAERERRSSGRSNPPSDRTCPDCHADLDSAEHHAECVAPLDQLEEGA